MKTEAKREIGFNLYEIGPSYGTFYLKLSVVQRVDGKITNPRDDYDTTHAIGDLSVQGQFYESSEGLQLIGFGARFSPYCIDDVAQVERIGRTLKRIAKCLHDASASEPGDILMAIAKALGATFIVTTKSPGSMYSECEFTNWTLADGRNLMRRMIEQHIASKQAKAA